MASPVLSEQHEERSRTARGVHAAEEGVDVPVQEVNLVDALVEDMDATDEIHEMEHVDEYEDDGVNEEAYVEVGGFRM